MGPDSKFKKPSATTVFVSEVLVTIYYEKIIKPVKDSKEPFVTVQYGTIRLNSVEFVTVLFNVKFMFV